MSPFQSSGQYYAQLDFARLTTYSFNRGPQPANQVAVYLTDSQGQFHPSSHRLSQWAAADPATLALAAILATPLVDDVRLMCAPIYRDALVFEDSSGQIISVLNICLACNSLLTAAGHDVPLDYAAYAVLRDWLKKVGHPVEDLK